MDCPTVFVVDDDLSVLRSVQWLLEPTGLYCELYSSAKEWLSCFDSDRPGCLVLDEKLPEISGLEVFRRLRERTVALPTIFVTGHADVPLCVEVFESEVFAFLEKPLGAERLVSVVQDAIALDARQRRAARRRREMEGMLTLLTPREQMVMESLLLGKNVKRIAVELGAGPKTIAKYRARVLEKLCVDNEVTLLRLFASVFPDRLALQTYAS
jgi:FixJ family two-component response regulator